MNENVKELLAREAAEAEARAEAEEHGEARPMRGQRARRQATDPSQVYAVRIPASRLRELRELADQVGTPPTALIRQWVLERLDAQYDIGEQPAEPGPPVPLGAGSLESGQIRLGPRRRRNDTAACEGLSRERLRA